MNVILSKGFGNKSVILIELKSGGYQIKSGNLTRTFRKTPFLIVFDYFMGF